MLPSESTLPSHSTVTLLFSAFTNSRSCSTTTTLRSPAMPVQQGRGLLGLLVGHAGDGFVHQQQLRVLHEQHADLQPLLLAVAQQAREVVRADGEADLLHGLLDAARASPRSTQRMQAIGLRGAFSASSRFSKTVSASKTVGFWNFRPMPRLAMVASSSG
jgi:hypothetical protein